MLYIAPAEIEHTVNWNQAVSYLSLDLDPIVLKHKLNDIVKGDTVELLPHFSFSDPLISSIFHALQQELFNPGLCGQLYIAVLITNFLYSSTTKLLRSKTDPNFTKLLQNYQDLRRTTISSRGDSRIAPTCGVYFRILRKS